MPAVKSKDLIQDVLHNPDTKSEEVRYMCSVLKMGK